MIAKLFVIRLEEQSAGKDPINQNLSYENCSIISLMQVLLMSAVLLVLR